jgi:hypothetical protein
MKIICMRKMILILVCYGLFFCNFIGLPSLMAADAPDNSVIGEIEEVPQEDPYRYGQLDYIGEEGVTINDQGYRIINTTYYRTEGGGVTGVGYFDVGDAVQFLFDPQEMTIVELRMKEREVSKKVEKENMGGGMLQLKDGVWTN